MQRHYTSSTWERGRGVIAGGDLGGHYWGEVRNLGLWVTPEGDVFGICERFREDSM